MARKSDQNTRYGIGEWYGRRLESISASNRIRYAGLTGINKEPCPHRPGEEMCNKSGGVCSLASYRKMNDQASIDPNNQDLITLCPMRFWQNLTVFKEVGHRILKTEKPVLIKEIGFLRSVDKSGKITGETVGRIDMVLARLSADDELQDWGALEMQAVYFSGVSMKSEFQAIENEPTKVLFPNAIRRPDFRSSGPKRLMPQLQIKVPSLRRWGKKMAVVIDKAFFESIAPLREVPDISNADIVWFIVNYDGPEGELRIFDVILTTLESSVEGLTAGEPITREEFEQELSSYLLKRQEKVVRLS